MKMLLCILLPFFILLSIESCKKDTQQSTPFTPTLPLPKIVADPVDILMGTYKGTMRTKTITIYPGHIVSIDSTSPAIIYTDSTTAIKSYIFSKVSTDTFNTGGLFWVAYYNGSSNQATYDIKYDSSGVYLNRWTENDTLKTFASADSIYYSSNKEILEDGGYTYTEFITIIFSGKKQ